MYGSQYDGNNLFSGGGFMPSQATQATEPSSSRSRGQQGVSPLTVKQISEARQSGDDKSNFVVNDVEVTNVKLVGLVMNKIERVTDVSFTLDDGTGRIEINRWVNEAADTNEMAVIQNGMYVRVNGHLKGFQGKVTVTAFSVRPITNFDEVTLHFIECVHVHLVSTKKTHGGGPSAISTNNTMNTPSQSVPKAYQQAPVSNQFSAPPSHGNSVDINDLVNAVFKEPANLAADNGVHIEDVAKQLQMPVNKIRTVVDHLVNEGFLYSTIDENHFKSTCNG